MTKDLEAILFLEMKNKTGMNMTKEQLRLSIKENVNRWSKLAESDQNKFSIFSNEIHLIYTRVNTSFRSHEVFKDQVNSIQEYHINIGPVSSEILKMANDFGITLKREVSKNSREAIISCFGIENYEKFMKSINQDY